MFHCKELGYNYSAGLLIQCGDWCSFKTKKSIPTTVMSYVTKFVRNSANGSQKNMIKYNYVAVLESQS